MKLHTKLSFWALTLAAWMLFPACQTDFTNPNAPTDAQVLNSREGLLNLATGVRVLYSTSGVRFMVENNAVTAREAAITTTFINMIELEDGGDALTDFNTNVEGLWASMLRVMGACEDIVEAVDEVELLASTRNNLRAYANIFRAMAIGALAQNYAEVVIQTNRQNEATFVTRAEAYAEAIRLLEAAIADLQGDLSPEVAAILQGNLNLSDVAHAYLARYRLFSGNYEGAIQAAAQVNTQRTSVFIYDQLNQNPIWARVIQNNVPNFRPRDHFGLPEGLRPEPADGRRAFYLIPSEDTNVNGFALEGLRGFFENDNSPIPVFLPGEMALITAEAHIRKASPDLNAAVEALNQVRTKTNDPFGLNAGLAPYSGPLTGEALLDELFINRRAELFFTGLSLEDSRRFNRPEPQGSRVFTDERNRNFYPFPLRERNNNANTPANPPI